MASGTTPPTSGVYTILSTLAGANNMVRAAQQNRILKNKYWRPVLIILMAGKAYTGPALAVDSGAVTATTPLVAISQLNAADAKSICTTLWKNRAYRNVFVGLFGGRTFNQEAIPVEVGGGQA